MAKGVKNTKPNYKKILEIATEIAKHVGLEKTSTCMIAKELKKHHTLIYAYYRTIDELRQAVIEKAVKENIPEIIYDALINGKLRKEDLTDEIKKKLKDIFDNDDDRPGKQTAIKD